MKLQLGIWLLLFVWSAHAQTSVSIRGASINWENQNFDFGDIVQGDKVTHTYKFVNSGSEPLIITNVEVTCGCTVPKGWPRDPIMPGNQGEIEVQFNTSGKSGRQSKVVTVVSNAGNSQITFTAMIIDKKR